jgi:hypothetical protein
MWSELHCSWFYCETDGNKFPRRENRERFREECRRILNTLWSPLNHSIDEIFSLWAPRSWHRRKFARSQSWIGKMCKSPKRLISHRNNRYKASCPTRSREALLRPFFTSVFSKISHQTDEREERDFNRDDKINWITKECTERWHELIQLKLMEK